jgi:DNA repair protein RecN (Recombination protein N)
MLLELRIRNLAIIEVLDLAFSKGLNILTGETGAGKSIILNAVHLLLGDRVTDELVRSSEEEAIVEALFDVSKNGKARDKMREKDLDPGKEGDTDSLLVKRIISRSGRGKAYLNGNLANLAMVAEICGELLSIYGQHEHQSLQRVETHVEFLDEFGELIGLRGEFESRFRQFLSISEEIEMLRGERERRGRERELMAFQSQEIGAAELRIGEDGGLKEERSILAHARKLMEFARGAEERLYGEEGSVIEKVQAILHQGHELATIDPALSQPLRSLESTLIQLQETALNLREYSGRMEVNPDRLEEIESRLEEIELLKRKYGSTVEAVLLFKEKIDEALRSLTSEDERLSQLEGSLKPVEEAMLGLGRRLTEERKKASKNLRGSVEKELASLGMKKTTFEILIEAAPPSPRGLDRVEFLISPNVGEPVKPLARIASGGELSRIMLAMKKILAKVGGRQVLVFDEVDSGIGGATAEVVGRKLKELSRDHQILCVTHLPQIASFADVHHSVRKETRSGRTLTRVDRLEGEGITDEVARMLGGLRLTEKTRAHAREMIENARRD